MKNTIVYLIVSIISFMLIIAMGTLAFFAILSILFLYATARVIVYSKKKKHKKSKSDQNMKDVTKYK